MTLKISMLASGSNGNCLLLATDGYAILVDAGISYTMLTKTLSLIGESVDKIQAVCLTHEHHDHMGGLRSIQKNRAIPLYANHGTFEGGEKYLTSTMPLNIFTTDVAFNVREFRIMPYRGKL